jgi:hypothetical protein
MYLGSLFGEAELRIAHGYSEPEKSEQGIERQNPHERTERQRSARTANRSVQLLFGLPARLILRVLVLSARMSARRKR